MPSKPLQEWISTDVLALGKVLRHLVGDRIGRLSNGGSALWIGKTLPSSSSIEGCLLVIDADYIPRRRTELASGQIKIEGIWQLTLIQYGDRDADVLAAREIKDTLVRSLPGVTWRPSTPLRNNFPRSICYIEFSEVINGCTAQKLSL